ncbi:MAG: PAS domain S-box protein [Candidatus Kuenenia sp.]|nr:PAS domain S-box protein [Candidatus Kuenenia hertensis]
MISDVSGNIRVSTDSNVIGLNIADSIGFKQAGKGEACFLEIPPIGDVFDKYEAKNWEEDFNTLYAYIPIKENDGRLAGIMVFKSYLSILDKEILEIPHLNNYNVYLINKDGLLISGSNPEKPIYNTRSVVKGIPSKIPLVEPGTNQFTKSVRACLTGSKGYDMNGYINYAGETVLGAWHWIPELQWGIIVEINTDKISLVLNDLKNPISKILSYLTIAGIVMAVGGIAFAFIIGQKIANPILKLTKATRKMSAGDFTQRVEINAQDEIQELGDAFNVMSESVQEKTTKLEEATNFLKSILVSSTEHSIIASDLDGNILEFNEGAARMFQYTPEQIINKSDIDILYTKEDIKSGKLQKILKSTLFTGSYKDEMKLVRRDGKIFTGYTTITKRNSFSGAPIGYVIIIRDITEQKLLEEELNNYTVHLEKIVEERTQRLIISEEKYKRLFESSKDVVFFCDINCQIVDINQAGIELFGYDTKNDILQLNLVHHLFFDLSEGKTIIGTINKNGYIKDFEIALKRKDGSKIPCMMTSSLRRNMRNNIIGYEGIIIDLTEWKKIEQEKDILNNINKLLASRLDIREVYKSLSEELHKVVDFDRLSIALLDEKRVEFLTFAVSKDYRFSELEEGVQYSKHGTLAGKVVEDGEFFVVHDTARGPFSTDPILFKEGIKSRLSVPLICKGEIIGSLNFGSKKVNNFTEMHVDIINKIVPQLAIAIDNTRLFDKIKYSEEKYRNLVEDIEDIIFRLDKNGRFMFLNNALKNVTGYTPKEFYDTPSLALKIIHKDDVASVKKITKEIINGKTKVYKGLEYRVYCKNGKELWFSQNTYPIKNKNGSVVGVEGIIQDITDKKKIEEQIRRSERLASIGELAASIAHEIRNPLGAISNSVCMLKRDLALNDDDKSLFDMVVEETEWLNNIISNFLTFAHPAEYHFIKSDIIKIVDETLFLLEKDAKFNGNIKIKKIYSNNLPKIFLDRIWIKKVFWNLLINSIDAMPNGGEITISLKKSRITNDDKIEIIISDSGIGISPESIKKIFEPFFTTKKSRGTGLGLSIVHRVLDNHGGTIDVKSIQNRGTIFTIRLPIHNKKPKTISI